MANKTVMATKHRSSPASHLKILNDDALNAPLNWSDVVTKKSFKYVSEKLKCWKTDTIIVATYLFGIAREWYDLFSGIVGHITF